MSNKGEIEANQIGYQRKHKDTKRYAAHTLASFGLARISRTWRVAA
jgi:hypothetical protein